MHRVQISIEKAYILEKSSYLYTFVCLNEKVFQNKFYEIFKQRKFARGSNGKQDSKETVLNINKQNNPKMETIWKNRMFAHQI